MADTANIKTLTDIDGQVAPRTKVKAISDDDGNTLDTLLSNLSEEIVANNRNLLGSTDRTNDWYNGSLCNEISAGNFANCNVGDYIVGKSSGKKYWIADMDYLYNGYGVAEHHLLIWGESFGSYRMNTSNTTAGGFLGSAMRTDTLPTIQTTIASDFGSDLMSFNDLPSNAINSSATNKNAMTGMSSACVWDIGIKCTLPGEVSVYGSQVWGNGFDTGIWREQMAICRLAGLHSIIGGHNVWLRDVASSVCFAIASGDGYANYGSASRSLEVRPLAIIGRH